MFFLHIPVTLLPFIYLPEMTFVQFPWALSLEGQYIFKNIVLMSAVVVIIGGQSRRPAETVSLETAKKLPAIEIVKAA